MNKVNYLIVALCICACAPNNSSVDRSDNKNDSFELVAHIAVEPDGLHPLNSASLNTSYVFESIHKTLLKVDLESLELIPEIAKNLPVQLDSTNFRYIIKKGPVWDDGSPVTAEDVRFTLLLALCPLNNAPQKRLTLAEFVDSVRVESSNEIQYSTQFQFAGSNHIWSDLPLLSKSFYDPQNVLDKLTFAQCKEKDFEFSQEVRDWFLNFNSRKYSHNPEYICGLGGYKVTHWEEGQFITLEKKENWWGDSSTSVYNKTNPDAIHFKVISDEQTTTAAILNKEIDVAYSLSSAQAHDLSKNENFKYSFHLNKVDIFGFTFLAINSRPSATGNPVLSDPKVRLAMSYSTPYDAILETIYNMGTRQASIVNPKRKYYHDKLPMPKLDLTRADSILTSSGWIDSNGDGIRENKINGKMVDLRFDIGFADNPSFRSIAELISMSFLEVGIATELKAIEANAMFPKLLSQEFDVFITSLTGDGGFEDLSPILHTDAWKHKGFNFTGFGDSITDQLLNNIKKTFDEPGRNQLYRDLQEKFNEQNTFIVLFATQRKIAVSNKFNNPSCFAQRPSILLGSLELTDK